MARREREACLFLDLEVSKIKSCQFMEIGQPLDGVVTKSILQPFAAKSTESLNKIGDELAQ
ncbi:hypothetical protein D7Y04_42280 [Corallococcus sp. AB038B]|nr:hypothetical protein D7Y04_42280 [Corallococcus sp. AB038B]